VPELKAPQRLDRWLGALAAAPALRLALMPEGSLQLRQLPQMNNGAILVVGPEGGLSENDTALLTQTGFCGLRLGPRILRTETAGIAALAELQALYGDL